MNTVVETIECEIIDVRRNCRACLNELSEDYFCLEGYYLEEKLLDIYNNVLSIEIDLNQNLPAQICSVCYNDVIKFYCFKNKLLQSEQKLAEISSQLTPIDTDVLCGEIKDEFVDCVIQRELEIHDNLDEEIIIEQNGDDGSSDAEKKYDNVKIRKGKKKPRKKANCGICGKRMDSYKISTHMRTHTKEKPYECDQCSFRFTEKSNLNRHMKTHRSERPYVCGVCGKGFLRPSSRAVHEMTTHKTEKDILCPICGKGFKHHNFLKKHYANVHGEKETSSGEQKQDFQCPVCGNFYKTKQSLVVHQKKHADPKPFLCNTCGKAYSTKGVLDLHEKTHTGEKNLSCDVCLKKFRFLSSLKIHKMIHKGEKPLACPICQKHFRQHSHLNTHIKGQHSSLRPFKCTFCTKAFKQQCNLVVHKRIHTGETPYTCDICQKGFHDSSSMKKHQKHHFESTTQND